MQELYLSSGLDDQQMNLVQELAQVRGVEPELVAPARIRELCHAGDHQGVLARMGVFPYADWNLMLGELTAGSFVLALDHLEDPHNLGTLIRSAEIFGVDAVVMPDKGQVGVTSAVARSSAGAVNRVPLVRIENLREGILALKKIGLACVGASEKSSLFIDQFDLASGLVLVIGNEGRGLSTEVQDVCDECVAIPQMGEIGSLNAAAAGAIFFYEVSRQRRSRVG